MIVDSSCVIAVLRNEPEANSFIQAMRTASSRKISAANLLEASIVIDKLGIPTLSRRLDTFMTDADIVVEPVTEAQARIARDAYRDFGKGSGHPAQLNFGDCFAYALAKVFNEPLLFKGDDFGQTDVRVGR